MDYIEKLKSLLYHDVQDYNDLSNKIEVSKKRIDLFIELGNMLKQGIDKVDPLLVKIILDELYPKDVSYRFDVIDNFNRYNNDPCDENKIGLRIILEKVSSDYKFEVASLKKMQKDIISRDDMEESKRIVSYLKYGQAIGQKQIDFIQNKLFKKGIGIDVSNEFIASVAKHNGGITSEGPKIGNEEILNLINLYTLGYEIIELPDGNYDYLDSVVDNIIASVDKNNPDFTLLDYYNREEKEYMYRKLMRYYQNNVYEIISILKDDSCKYDASIFETIRTDYLANMNVYMELRQELDELESTPLEDENEEIIDRQELYHLCYATENDNPSKCFFVKDLEDIREESLNRIQKLLEDFRYGNTSRLKALTRDNICLMELKWGQIRIILEPAKNNNYIVKGVFIKKAMNDVPMYNKMFDRSSHTLGEEYDKEVENVYTDYISKNSRKGLE